MLAGFLKVDNQDGLDSNIEMPFVTPLNIISNQPTAGSDTLMLKRLVSDMRAQRWEIQTRLMPMSNHPFLYRSVFNGYSNSFAIRPPQRDRQKWELPFVEYATTFAAGPPTYLQGARRIYLDNAQTPDNTYLPGDFINITDGGNYSKLHMVTSANAFSLYFTPGLRRQMVGALQVYAGKRVRGYFFIDQDTKLGVSYIDGVLSDPGQITLIEDLR